MARFTVLLQEEVGGGYSVTVPALEGCQTQGESVEEALAMAADAIEGNLAVRVERGMEMPIEDPRIIVASVDVPMPTLALVG